MEEHPITPKSYKKLINRILNNETTETDIKWILDLYRYFVYDLLFLSYLQSVMEEYNLEDYQIQAINALVKQGKSLVKPPEGI